jgi:hypothetical protein
MSQRTLPHTLLSGLRFACTLPVHPFGSRVRGSYLAPLGSPFRSFFAYPSPRVAPNGQPSGPC